MDVVTTNAIGDAYSKDLPFGTYIGKTSTPTHNIKLRIIVKHYLVAPHEHL